MRDEVLQGLDPLNAIEYTTRAMYFLNNNIYETPDGSVGRASDFSGRGTGLKINTGRLLM